MPAPVIAVLGPTNTGKTHLALERMLEHRTGMLGFPLRLLARENYDRVAKARGADEVALITGEERIVPASPRYLICTVEAMPVDRSVDFLGVDEIQLCADRERGHVFTDRLLHARGREETMLLGADTIRPVLEDLIPEAGVISRRRLSKLSYEEPSKIERLPKRSAVVGFSIAEVYEIATRLRHLRGGAAVVFGALSPRTRNAQVGLYQSGEVDYLVATDAIGMGLNLDIHHVALNRIDKFDGQGPRALAPADIAQIAGRAGRHVRDGTFGATSELGPLPRALVRAVERHQFDPIKQVYWRNAELDFRSLAALHESLRARPTHPRLRPMQRADDQAALRELARDANDALDVTLLWQICQIPDFHGAPDASHVHLLSEIFDYLSGTEKRLPEDWVAAQVKLLDRTQGDVETLLDRIARIRTWTYLSHRPEWLADAAHWQARTRAVEDRLSDALHERLTSQFVDRRAALLNRLPDGETRVEVEEDGTVTVQGVPAGTLSAWRFRADPDAPRSLISEANRGLRAIGRAKADALVASEDATFTLSESGKLLWNGESIGRIAKGDSLITPRVEISPGELLDQRQRERVRRRGSEWLVRHIGGTLSRLLTGREGRAVGAARGLLFALRENLGSAPRKHLSQQIAMLKDSDRRELRRLNGRIGRFSIYAPAALSPEAVRLRGILWRAAHPGQRVRPLDARTSHPRDPQTSSAYYEACGYHLLGPRAIRVDAAQRLWVAAKKRAKNARLKPNPALARMAGCSTADLRGVLGAMGFRLQTSGASPSPQPSPPKGERAEEEQNEPSMADGERPPSPLQGERAGVRGEPRRQLTQPQGLNLTRSRSMRREGSKAEAILWRHLRERRLAGFKFRRQHRASGFILDFYCPEAHLAIELDGGQHGEKPQQEYDQRRTNTLKATGIQIIRFWNDDVLKQTDTVLEQIQAALPDAPSPRPSPPEGERE